MGAGLTLLHLSHTERQALRHLGKQTLTTATRRRLKSLKLIDAEDKITPLGQEVVAKMTRNTLK